MNKLKNFTKTILKDLWEKILTPIIVAVFAMCVVVCISSIVGYLISIFEEQKFGYKYIFIGCITSIIICYVCHRIHIIYKYLRNVWWLSDD